MENEHCIWCGETYERHGIDYPGRPIPKTPCLGLKSYFVAKENNSSPLPQQGEEEQTKPQELDFFDALRQTLEGKRITKLEWGSKDIYGLIENEELRMYINGEAKQWILSDADIRGTDWIIL